MTRPHVTAEQGAAALAAWAHAKHRRQKNAGQLETRAYSLGLKLHLQRTEPLRNPAVWLVYFARLWSETLRRCFP